MRINISTVSQVFQAISSAFKAVEALVAEINAALKPTVSVPASTSADATAPTDTQDDQSVTP
jgi:hypothetical protein